MDPGVGIIQADTLRHVVHTWPLGRWQRDAQQCCDVHRSSWSGTSYPHCSTSSICACSLHCSRGIKALVYLG
ncbi:hypothetical protein C8R44DRAFT_790429 [Mycena epipterygia]|nr:hypothetical protein C8R44DRAFT_790429 [Mycena epipterygia]